MLDQVIAKIEAVGTEWRKEAPRLRAITPNDPVADTLECVAGELATQVREIRATCYWLTVREFAESQNRRSLRRPSGNGSPKASSRLRPGPTGATELPSIRAANANARPRTAPVAT